MNEEFNVTPENKDLNSQPAEGDSTQKNGGERELAQDEFVIGNGFALPEDNALEQPAPTPKKKRSSRGVIRSIIWILCIIFASAGLAIGAVMCVIDYFGLGASKTITVEIEEGESLSSIAQELKEKNALKFPWLFELYCNAKSYDEEFKVGVHTIKTDMGYANIVNEFAYTEGYNVETVTVTIPQLARIDDIAELLAKKGVCTLEQFYDAAENSSFDYSFINDIPVKSVRYRLEGYLFPDTYEFYVWNSKEGAEFAIDRMLSNFDQKFNAEFRAKAEDMGYSLHEILTMASIIELECSGYYDEMPKVSAVFYNRLHHWGDQPKMLGSSPTADYPYGSGNYDTNKIEGLPPGPMCTTSEEAIKAALYPEKKFEEEYFYFVTDTDFKFYYTRTLDEHNYTISSLRVQGIWGED